MTTLSLGPRWPRVRFCDGPSRDAVTRLDLNERGLSYEPSRVRADGFSLGMAELSGEPGGRGRVWTERTLPLPLLVRGARPQALARLEAVARELTRSENWLEWQLSAESAPRWFHTYAAAPSPLSLDRVYVDGTRVGDTWTATLSAPADPFAVGEPIVLGPYAVTNHPASGALPMWLDLPAVEGEAAAPLEVVLEKTAAGGMLGPAVAVTEHAPGVVTAASWGAAVASAVTDGGYLAGAYRSTAGALTDWTTVGTFQPAGLARGRWRTLLRAGGASANGSLLLRWRVAAAGVSSRVYSTPRLVTVGQQIRWIDAGEVPWPLTSGRLPVTGTTVLTLEAKRVVPGGEIRFDDRLLMLSGEPDTTLLRLSPDYVGTGAVSAVIDAEDRVAEMAVAGAPMRSPAAAGGWPYLSPHRPNRLWVAQSLEPTAMAGVHDNAASTVTVTATYRPRYLWGV